MSGSLGLVAGVALAATLVAAVLDWWVVAADRRRLEVVLKPLTMVLLIGVALAITPDDPTVRVWFVVALGCSLVGDLFLLAPTRFAAGLGAFLAAHVAYLGGFLTWGLHPVWVVMGAVVVVAALGAIGSPVVAAVREGDEPELLGPVVAYLIVISLMVVVAVGTAHPLAAVGALLFYASDGLIAWGRFVEPAPGGRVAVMVTYHLAQVALVLSLV